MKKFLGLLIIIGVIVGGYFVYDNYIKDDKKDSDTPKELVEEFGKNIVVCKRTVDAQFNRIFANFDDFNVFGWDIYHTDVLGEIDMMWVINMDESKLYRVYDYNITSSRITDKMFDELANYWKNTDGAIEGIEVAGPVTVNGRKIHTVFERQVSKENFTQENIDEFVKQQEKSEFTCERY